MKTNNGRMVKRFPCFVESSIAMPKTPEILENNINNNNNNNNNTGLDDKKGRDEFVTDERLLVEVGRVGRVGKVGRVGRGAGGVVAEHSNGRSVGRSGGRSVGRSVGRSGGRSGGAGSRFMFDVTSALKLVRNRTKPPLRRRNTVAADFDSLLPEKCLVSGRASFSAIALSTPPMSCLDGSGTPDVESATSSRRLLIDRAYSKKYRVPKGVGTYYGDQWQTPSGLLAGGLAVTNTGHPLSNSVADIRYVTTPIHQVIILISLAILPYSYLILSGAVVRKLMRIKF